MPRDSTPRMVPSFSASPVAGITVPGRASTTLMPARALGAPQTICSVSLPSLTLHRRSLSALGCFSAVTTSPTMKSFRPAPGSVTLSTSRPMAVSRSAIVLGVGVGVQMLFQPGEGKFHRDNPPSSVGMSSAAKP